MALDANKNREIKQHSYRSMVQEENMLPIFHREGCVPSRFDGKDMIDHMETANIPQFNMKITVFQTKHYFHYKDLVIA